MLSFRLFGIPVRIEPWFWLVSALLGGALSLIDAPNGFLLIALSILAIAVSILIHELGHALTGKGQGAPHAEIVLNGMGGYASFPGARFNRPQDIWVTLTGPLWQFVFGAAVLLCLISYGNNWEALDDLIRLAFQNSKLPILGPEFYAILGHAAAASAFGPGTPLAHFLGTLIFISLYWPVLNLIPVLPLDGGRIMAAIMGPWDQRKPRIWSAAIGLGVGALLVITNLSGGGGPSYFGVLLVFMAIMNWQAAQRGF